MKYSHFLLFLFPFIVFSQKGVVIKEDFSQKNNLFQEINSNDILCTIENGVYRIENNSKENYFVGWKLDMIMHNPFDYEIGIKSITGAPAFVIFDMSENGEYFKAIALMDEWMKPQKYIKNGRADAGVYAKELNEKPKKIRIEFENDAGPYGGQNQVTWMFNDKEIGKEFDRLIHDNLSLQINPGGILEIDYLYINGTELIIEKKPEAFILEDRNNDLSNSVSKAEVKAGECMYGVLISDKEIGEITEYASCEFTEKVYIDDIVEAEYAYYDNASGIQALGKRYEIDIAPALNDILYPKQSSTLSAPFSKLISGKHNVRIVVSFKQSGMSMSKTLGEFNFTYDAENSNGQGKMKDMYNAYRKKALSKVKLPLAGMKNEALERGIKEAVLKAKWNQEVIKVIIMDSDWQYMYHSTWNTITDRYLNVAIVVKDSQGECIVFYPVALQQKAEGTNYSSNFRLGGMHKIEEYIDCANTIVK